MRPVSEAMDGQAAENWLNFFSRTLNAFAYLTEAMIHKNMGLRYIDGSIAFALGILVLYPIFWPEHDQQTYLVFAGLFVLSHIGQRFSASRRRITGDRFHSFYSGEPLLAGLFPRLSERAVKRHVEPLFVILLGGIALYFDRPLGTLLMVSAGAMIATNEQQMQRERERVYAMHDALLENQMAAERFRGWYGDGN